MNSNKKIWVFPKVDVLSVKKVTQGGTGNATEGCKGMCNPRPIGS